MRTPHRWLIISCLIFAGEMIFSLPFHIPRYFRPTMLNVLNLSNTNLGDAFAIYGIMAMASYFPSGVFADRLSARKLMSISLAATALGGIYLATIPGRFGLSILFGYWGVTTILLFWSAMLKVTREWGGVLAQGRAFGLLDGGRGLAGAGAATVAVFLLAANFPDQVEYVTHLQRVQAFKSVIYFYSFLTFVAAVLVWHFIPETEYHKSYTNSHTFTGMARVLRSRAAWLQAIIVVCAYCGYRGLDYYALYGIDILGMNEIASARFVSNATYLRPVAAITAGIMADRYSSKKAIGSTFSILLLSYLILLVAVPSPNTMNIIFTNLTFTYITVYALRGVYFALFEETNVPDGLTGTTVGLVSLVGFTPDVFFSSIAGRILDGSPGLAGYHNFFGFLSLFAGMGVVATVVLAFSVNSSKMNLHSDIQRAD